MVVEMSPEKYYTIYQITNLINGMIYIGCHSTTNLSDKYMGSGRSLKNAIKNEGISNFKKEILFIYNTSEEMMEKEAELVNAEFIRRTDVYNIAIGGHLTGFLGGNHTDESRQKMMGKINAVDVDGNTIKVSTDDPRLISGELRPFSAGMVSVKDSDGNTMRVHKTDPRYLSGELVGVKKGSTISDDHKLILSQCGLGRTHTDESKEKISKGNTGKKRTPEQNKRNSEYQRGKTIPQDVRDKIRNSNLGKVNTAEHNQKIANARRGKKKSPEVIENMKRAWVIRKENQLKAKLAESNDIDEQQPIT